jgi:hypothetical protein
MSHIAGQGEILRLTPKDDKAGRLLIHTEQP